MKIFSKPYSFAVFFSVLLTLFSLYALLDIFVIPRRYSSSQTAAAHTTAVSSQSEGGTEQSTTPVTEAEDGSVSGVSFPFTAQKTVTDNSYSDENISVTINEYRTLDTTVYVADIYITDPSYLYTAFAQGTFGRNITAKTSVTAASCGAIIAINGDYYGSQTKGYVIREGVLYRSVSAGRDALAINADGSFSIVTEGAVSAQSLLDSGVREVLSFGPALIENGAVTVDADDEVGKAMAENPRTAIAYMGECHYLFVVSDGRTSKSSGLSLCELAEFIEGLGAVTAYNLDGGGSSTMYFCGKVINNPTTNGSTITERSVSDIVCIGY